MPPLAHWSRCSAYACRCSASTQNAWIGSPWLTQIDGSMPRLNAIPQGCAFNPRCAHTFDRCRAERPDLLPAGATQAACWLYAESPVAESPVHA